MLILPFSVSAFSPALLVFCRRHIFNTNLRGTAPLSPSSLAVALKVSSETSLQPQLGLFVGTSMRPSQFCSCISKDVTPPPRREQTARPTEAS